MIVQVLTADPIAVSIRIVPPAKDAGIRDVVWEEIVEPVDAVRSRPSLVLMAVQAMDSDDTEKTSVRDTRRDAGLLSNWVCPFRNHLEALRR